MEFANLEEEFDATYDEMRDITPACGDEVLADVDGTGEIRIGKVIETGTTSSRYEPPQHYFGVRFEDGTEKGFMDDDGFLIKRKAAA